MHTYVLSDMHGIRSLLLMHSSKLLMYCIDQAAATQTVILKGAMPSSGKTVQ